MFDDGLRRTYVSRRHVMPALEVAPETLVKITPWQNPAHTGLRMGSVGPALSVSPFDEFGRRIYEMQFEGGRLPIVQGITELTPRYARLESLVGPERVITWDSRISTGSIPRDVLARILAKAVPQDDSQARLQIVRFYMQAKRYPEAHVELERIIEEFPVLGDLKSEADQLRRRAAESLLDELKLRRNAGQHQLVQTVLENFPGDEVSGESRVDVRDMLSRYEQENARISAIGESLRAAVAAMTDPDHRGLAAPIAEEVVRELSHNTVDRLAPFVQLMGDATLTAEEKVSLALTGWLLGAEAADRNMAVALSLVKVRDAVVRYLREPLANERQLLLDSITSQEGASVERLAKLIAHMKPPWHDPALASDEDGFLELVAPGQTEDGNFRYLVQLPPEYDPYRKYPTLIVLNGAYNSPEQELNFWAGDPPPPVVAGAVAGAGDGPARMVGAPPAQAGPARGGHAMRYGYITVAVEWSKPHQYEYEFSAREHVAVLTAMRDANRRFSIDADRVFLTGHGIGGEAAWDLAQAHPDLWAGALPFVALAEKYTVHYWKNGRYVPLYFIAGELDGRSMSENAPVWDRYLRTPGFDATIVEFQGRGHEPFHDEILNLFDWMGRKSRSAPPKEFICETLRPWDNFFWWLECDEFPAQFMLHPTDFSGRRARSAAVEGKQQADNRIWAKSTALRTSIWLNPDIVDFSKPIRITFEGDKLAVPEGGVRPDPVVLLEDVRTRADRQRPFWAKIESP
jgi:predicted esterase